jgi:hypothetical protein
MFFFNNLDLSGLQNLPRDGSQEIEVLKQD